MQQGWTYLDVRSQVEFAIGRPAGAVNHPLGGGDFVVVDFVGFGHGTHGCAGQGLARLETQAVLRSLLRHVDRIELDGVPERAVNNVVQRFERLPVRLVPAGA